MPSIPNPQKKPPQKNSSKEKGSERIMSSAQRIVSSAVNVLEEEIAAGILAAKKLETKFINVEEVRNNQDELMNRIRRDTHEAVDLFLDAFATLAQQLNGITERAKTGNAEKSAVIQKKSTENLSQPVFLESDKILKPGESVSFQIVLSDDDKEVQISLTKSDFIGYDNKKISSRNILIKPNSVLLKAKEKVEIHIVVKIPKNATSGFYRAILSDKLNPKTVILITLQIDE